MLRYHVSLDKPSDWWMLVHFSCLSVVHLSTSNNNARLSIVEYFVHHCPSELLSPTWVVIHVVISRRCYCAEFRTFSPFPPAMREFITVVNNMPLSAITCEISVVNRGITDL